MHAEPNYIYRLNTSYVTMNDTLINNHEYIVEMKVIY
jgi:hypothetical protein